MFITLAGIEGAGKTTQTKNIAGFLDEIKQPYILTREPGGTDIGKKIRSILLDPDSTGLSSKAELLLYAADRAHHIESVILPALRSGMYVVCDRFMDCTTAFQGYGRGIDLSLIERIHDLVLSGLKPDITFLLDIDPESGLKRALSDIKSGERSEKESRFEQEALEFHKKVREGYLALAEKEPERFVIVDASMNADEIKKTIKNKIIQKKQSFFEKSAVFSK